MKSSSHEPLAGVSVYQPVRLMHNSNATMTDHEGKYSLTVSTKDSLKLIFSSLGYESINCSMPPLSMNFELNIIMKENAKELGAVTISGETRNKTTNMVIDLFDKRQRSYTLDGSIESLINTYSGVSSTNELSSQYLVRGGNFDENMIYVNGIEIHRPLLVRSGQQEGLSFINPNMVENVAFSTGGYNAEYGDKMSSVLDITYKKPTSFEGSIAASLMGGSIYVGNSTKKFSQITSVRYKTTSSLLKTTDTKAEYNPSFIDLQSYITYALSTKWEISFLGNYSKNKYEFTPQTRSTTFGTLSDLKEFKVYFEGKEKDNFLTYLTALNLKGKINNNLTVGITGSFFSSNEKERYDIGGSYKLEELVSSTNALLGIGKYHEHTRNKLKSDVVNISHWGNLKIDKHDIKWGFTLQQEKIKDQIKEWEMRDSAGYSIPSNDMIVSLYSNLKSDNKTNTLRYSAYLQDKYIFETSVGVLMLNAGVRMSYWDFNNELIVSPRASLSFRPASADQFTLRLASGIYYQTPFYKEFQRIVEDENGNNNVQLNKAIKSQRSIHFVLGGDYNFKAGKRPFKFTSEIYYKKLSDIVPYTINNVKVRYSGENETSGYIAGLDMRIYGEFVPGTDSWISFSLMKTEQNIHGVKVPLPTDQQYNFSIFFQDRLPGYERLKMSLKGSLTQGLPFSPPQKGYENGYFRSPAYKRIDIGFSWEILGEDYAIRKNNSFCKAFKNIWLGLDVLNLFDMKNTNTYYWIADVHNNQYAVPNYMTGRQLNVKLVADF